MNAKLALALLVACGAPSPTPAPTSTRDAYLHDARFRRATLEASLVNRENGYSRLRLERYATAGGGWDALPEWNPATEPLSARELDAAGGVTLRAPSPDARALATDVALDDASLRALGEEAFFRYPLELAPNALVAMRSREAAAAYGFWADERRGVGGLVRVALADGSSSLSFTCATCHASVRDGVLVIGVGNERLDLGALAVDASNGANAAPAAWGPGRVDVTTSAGTEPVRIPDLRPVRFLTHLHHDATLAEKDLETLAIRLETLVITSHHEVLRPPRAVALALASYVWSLADTIPSRSPRSEAETRGEALFRDRCAGCHAPPSFTGPPVPIDVVGTDPAIGRSLDRGTGMYRVPSLRGVGTRGLLLHDASVSSVDALLDPARTAKGHAYGLELDAPDRAALAAYLRTL